jgi:FKBP-type peptidyl-prolyl cis-trans isomerase FklB
MQWDNTLMRKSFIIGTQLLAACVMWLGIASAQQAPVSSSSQPASGQTSGQTAPAKKSAGATTAKKTPAATAAGALLTLKTDKQKQSYALGMSIGAGLQKQGVVADPALVARGLKDTMTAAKTLLTQDEMKAALAQLRDELVQQMQAKAHEAGAAKRKEGEVFLAANKSKPGVVTLPSGLQYKILTEGTGPKPTANDTVSCNYRGTLINGQEFDSSYKRGQPASFAVGGVIPGWTEALKLMPVGSRWQLFIPSELAYGDRGNGPDIGPGETLIFELELLSIAEKKK